MHYRSNNNKVFDPYMDYSGQTFCHLYVLQPVHVANDGKKLMYEVKCLKCGKFFTEWMENVFFYRKRSCGCTPHLDIIGGKFSRLTVEKCVGTISSPSGSRSKIYQCRCDCGKVVNVPSGGLGTRHAKSCGCLRVDQATRPLPEGMDYKVYRRLAHRLENIKHRCHNPTCNMYRLYGAKGIKVCDEWENDSLAFCKWFLSQPGSDDLKLEVDRIDSNGPYSPENCRLAYRPTQLMNRSVSHFIDVDGHHLTATQWAKILKLKHHASVYSYLEHHTEEETIQFLRKKMLELGVDKLSDREILYRIYGEKALDGKGL